ncbi:MAG: hypothetical protein EA400_15595 [Chromatiaceae bacterium]|nr:MAG: hypothetical protein EA400_15595 [Chromatiaceae bacterium]
MKPLNAIDAPALFWTEPDVFQWKAEKAVGALYAVGDVLRTAATLRASEREFLELFRWSETVPAQPFQQVAVDPRFYHWARLAFQLLTAVRGGVELPPTARAYLKATGIDSVRTLLDTHLAQYKTFVLALAILEGRAVNFSPLPVRLPFAIPATHWSFTGDAELALAGLRCPGIARAVVSGVVVDLPLPSTSLEWSSALRIEVAPTIEQAGRALVLQPHAFNVPGLRDIASVVSAGVPYQWASADTLRAALDWMQIYAPDTHAQFFHGMRVVALKPPFTGRVQNTSCSRLPGAAMFTTTAEPVTLAEDLIHEFYHNRLFGLEEQGDFLSVRDFDPVADEQFYSPWREDPRPLYGLLHATYVFERVLDYWLAVFEHATLGQRVSQYAAARVASLRIQLEVASQQLRRYAAFTPFGQSLFDALTCLVAAGAAEADRLGIDAGTVSGTLNTMGHLVFHDDVNDQPSTVADSLRRHRERFDAFQRLEGIRRDCSPTVQSLYWK